MEILQLPLLALQERIEQLLNLQQQKGEQLVQRIRILQMAARPAGEWFQDVAGVRRVNSISTIDLMPLKPYFQGMMSRSGAPFWFGSSRPYTPTVIRVSGCIASSMVSPSR